MTGPVILFDDPPRGDMCAGGNGAVGAGPVPPSAGSAHSPEPAERLRGGLAEPDHARIAAHGCYLQPPGEVAELAGAHRIVGRKVAQFFRYGHRLLRQPNEIAEGRANGGVR